MAPAVAGFSAAVLAVTIIVAVLLAAGAVWLLAIYQHPDEARGAWFPKLVVVISIWTAEATVLLFPLDVANRAACSSGLLVAADGDGGGSGRGACRLTLPMRQLWHAAFFTLLGLAYLVCPFTLFFYEGDSE